MYFRARQNTSSTRTGKLQTCPALMHFYYNVMMVVQVVNLWMNVMEHLGLKLSFHLDASNDAMTPFNTYVNVNVKTYRNWWT